MHENAAAFLKSSPNGRMHKTMHQWTENIRFIHENCSDKKFKLNSKFILKLANEERVGSFIETLAFKPKTICFDFSIGQHWGFLMEALSEMTNTVIKIDASGIGMADLIAEIVPAIANASESNMLILDLSSNALSAGNMLDLLKQIDKHNNVYQLNLSDNPDFANNPAETKEFFNFLFGKIRPLSHLRLDNTGFNDSCAQSFGSAIQNPHLLKVINFANHTASSDQITSLKKSIQKRTAEIRYFQISKTEIYSTLAVGMFDANTDVDWGALEQDYQDAQEELSKNIQQSYFSEVARRVRNHPIPRLLNQSHYEVHSDDDEVEFDHSLPTD